MVRVKNPDEIRAMVKDHPMELRRVFSIAAHIDHGKTTTSDYLLRRAGLMSDHDAGSKLMTDSDEEEQERGITIFTSVVLLSYEFKGQTYLFEINDTPGHISFTGEVSRALRGSDGAIILVDALEGVMTQTETNIRLAVGEEMCKPVLFINKVDRLISELKLPPKKVFATENIRIGICHGWGPPFRIRERVVNLFKEKPDVILYGHTHLFDDSLHNDVRFLNPGAVCDGSCALLEIDGGAIRFEQIRF